MYNMYSYFYCLCYTPDLCTWTAVRLDLPDLPDLPQDAMSVLARIAHHCRMALHWG